MKNIKTSIDPKIKTATQDAVASPSSSLPPGYEPQGMIKKASNDTWPLSWHGYRYRGITFNEEHHE